METSREKRINGIISDLKGVANKYRATLRINVTANYLLAYGEQIANAIAKVTPNGGNSVVTIEKGCVYAQLAEFGSPVDGDMWDGYRIAK